MKKQLLLFLFSLYSLLSMGQVCKGDAIAELAAQEGKIAARKINHRSSSLTNTYDLKYHRCEWQVNPNISYIQGTVTSYFKPVVNNFNTIRFDLIDTLKVDSVKYHGSKLMVTRANDLLTINFTSILAVGVLDSLTVYYQGNPVRSGFDSFVISKHGTEPILWTLSEPFGARDWWPCKQDLNDKIDSLDIIVTTPKAYRVASNGLLLSELEKGTNKIYHWKTTYPIAAYLVAIGVTNYAIYYDFVPMGNKQLDVLNYVYPENLDAAKNDTKGIVNIITLFNQLVGDYPFAKEKYGHAQFGTGGGMEHQTMSFMVSFGQELMAHECAHQWFGDHITCGSWQDIWLNEGFATYFEGLTEERFFPDLWKWWKSGKVANIISDPGGSVFCSDTTNESRIFNSRLTYNKGAYLLHMLRWKIGDSTFFKAIRNYRQDPKLSYGYAKTPDFIRHVEATSGKNLNTFFDQWYYKEGYPTYKAELTGPCCNYTLKLNQEQSHTSVSFFEMPVPIKFYRKNRDTTLVFNHTFSGQLFTIKLNYPVDSIKIDPDQWLLSGKNSVTYFNMVSVDDLNQLTNQIKLYPNPLLKNTSLTIENSNTANSITDVQIVDVVGNVVKKYTPLSGSSTAITLDISDLNAGIYIVNLFVGKYRVSKKIAKLSSIQ